MTIPDYQTLMRPMLEAFAEGETTVKDLLPIIAQQYGLTQDEVDEILPSGRTTVLASRAHWARTYLAKAGLLESPRRGHHAITPRGQAFLARHEGPISNSVLAQFSEFDAWRAPSVSQSESVVLQADPAPSITTPDDTMATAFAELDSALRDEILTAVLTLTPARFEQLIVDLLLAMGYGGGDADMGRALGKSGDGGIDGIINEDKLGLDAVYIQAKRYAPENKVGRPAIQAFVGSLTGEGANKGVFVTTSDYSREAVQFIERVQQRVILINGDRLARLMIQHDVGVRVRQTYLIRSIDEDYFADI